MKKGFTLIELLAVIVILAIIALIATPIIINIINDSQKSAATNSAQLYVDGLMKRIVSENMNGEFNPSSCTITNGNISCDGRSLDYTVDGDKPTSGTITFTNGVVTAYTLGISGYTVTKSGSTITTVKGEPEPIEFNGTYVAGGQNDTYIGIAYLDPTDLSATCTAQLAAQNLNDEETPTPTGIKSGCMKFYVYADDETNYSMILDHNTSGNVKWNSTGDNTTMLEAADRLAEDTSGWMGNPRLITANEIAHIVGIDEAIGWDSANSDSGWFYLDGSGTTWDEWSTTPNIDEENKSRYAWLFDYTYDCLSSGCNYADDNEYSYPTMSSSSKNGICGYWTLDAVSGYDSYYVWMVLAGFMVDEGVDVSTMGVRPVITISKSIFE